MQSNKVEYLPNGVLQIYGNDHDPTKEGSNDSTSDSDESSPSDDSIEELSRRQPLFEEREKRRNISDKKAQGALTKEYTGENRKAPRSMLKEHTMASDDRNRGGELNRIGRFIPAWKQKHLNDKPLVDRNLGGSSQQREGILHQRPAQQQLRYEQIEQQPQQRAIQGPPTFASYVEQTDPLANALESVSRVLNIQEKYPTLTIDTLQAYLMDLNPNKKAQTSLVPKVQLIHRVFKRTGTKGRRSELLYLDQPLYSKGPTSSGEFFEGNHPLHDISSHISNHPEICCLIYRDYDATSLTKREPPDEDLDTRVSPEKIGEFIEPVTESLASAIVRFLDHYKFNTVNTAEVNSTKLVAPYITIYHARQDDLTSFMGTLEESQRIQFRVMMDYILSQYENEYKLVYEMTSKGKITQKYIEYLFKPGEILVLGQDQEARGFFCKTWISKSKRNSRVVHRKSPNKDNFTSVLTLETWSWDFDGEFSKKETNINMDFDAKDHSEKNINELFIRPLRYVDDPTKTRLKVRGEWLWKCREKRMVSYDGTPEGLHLSSDERYMVDMMMYRALHRSECCTVKRAGADYLPLDVMTRENPPDETFIYLAPLTIKAHNLKRKKWVTLQIDRIREISWNTKAFESLVLEEKTKRLIHALVSNQIEAEKSTDLISGKGNGLVMLLHGAPGTGKTLTAESVAEIAKRPLYPVTCGDIGTKPEEVENYLEYDLHVGKTWGCVVLLDEADVFLEQRGGEDIHRNALVSVFLRVLERFNGILILTSSRVGTFDEAFKSRIQLAVHYGTLKAPQRTTIWKNFIERLRELDEEGVDFDDLNNKISQLASKEMNGREIRNAITTARQYARWERQQDRSFKLNYNVVKEVIETAGEFDKYINTLNDGLTQEELAKHDGIR
ncbi:AAA family ATPase [Trichoderma sp. SZMC 28011]